MSFTAGSPAPFSVIEMSPLSGGGAAVVPGPVDGAGGAVIRHLSLTGSTKVTLSTVNVIPLGVSTTDKTFDVVLKRRPWSTIVIKLRLFGEILTHAFPF